MSAGALRQGRRPIARASPLSIGYRRTGLDAVHFRIATHRNYTTRDQPYYRRGGPSKLTAHLLRDTRLSGTVRFPDGRPAGGLLIKAEGGPRSGTSINLAARTLADGSYVLDAPSESSYIVTVVDETWAAPSLSNVIVREGRAQGGLDLALTKGTLLHGQVNEAPDHRPAAGAKVWLTEEGGPVSKDLRRSGFRLCATDAKFDRRYRTDVTTSGSARAGIPCDRLMRAAPNR